VGPAGEMESVIAAAIAEGFRSYGRGGGAVLFGFGIKALVFHPASPPKGPKKFLEVSLRIRKKLKAKDKKIEKNDHPCYGCPISCVAMDGRLKKGIASFLKHEKNAEEIVERANDLGVDLFGAHLASKEYGIGIMEVLYEVSKGKDFPVEYPEKPVDPETDCFDSLGICKDAAMLLNDNDIIELVDSFLNES
jgi:hypothetical protein